MLNCALLFIQGLETGRRDSQEVFDVVPLLAEVSSRLRVTAAMLLAISCP
jgi:hypothetical protein